jgi:hypothetical protein
VEECETKMFSPCDESTVVLLESAVYIVCLTHHNVCKLHQARVAGRSLDWVPKTAFVYVLMLKREKSTSVTAYCAVAFPHALTPRPGFSINVNPGSTSQLTWMISEKYLNIVIYLQFNVGNLFSNSVPLQKYDS